MAADQTSPQVSGLYFWGIKMYVSVDIDLDDVWGEISNEDLLAECKRRNIGAGDPEMSVDLEAISLEISIGNHPRAIDLTKEYIWQSCGRIVN